MYKAKPKLEIDTNEKTDDDLTFLMDNEEGDEDGAPLNNSTLVNRAVQLYAELVRARNEGNKIFVGQVRSRSIELSTLTWE